MNFEEIMQELKIEAAPEIWRKYWEESQSALKDDDIYFLQKEYINKANEWLRIPKDGLEACIEAANFINSHNFLKKLAWHCHYILFCVEGDTRQNTNKWPSLDECLGNSADLFPVLILMSRLDKLVEENRKRNIPDSITLDTLDDLTLWMEHYYARKKAWGTKQLGWLIHHFTGKLFRIGRLQFMYKSFDGQIRVYKNKLTDKILALSNEGIVYRNDGQINGTNSIYEENAWKANFSKIDGSFVGNPISHKGYGINKEITLSEDEWEEVLTKGYGVLDVHIPATGKLTPELCGQSFLAAKEFFETHFKELPFKAFVCTSWLLDYQLQGLLGENSNIVRFQKELYLYPDLSDDSQTFQRVFGTKPSNLREFNCVSPMQLAIKDFVLEGGNMRSASMFLLTDNLEWGRNSEKYTQIE